LYQAQACDEQYIDEMIAVYHEFGSIIVLDDGVAMPHARPEKGALKTALPRLMLIQRICMLGV